MLFHSWNNWWWWCHWCSCLSSMHGNKIQYRQFQPQNENCERYFYTISGVFYSSLQVLLSESKEKKVLSLFAYKMVWSGIVLDLLKDRVVVNFPAEVFSFWVTKFFFHLREESNAEKLWQFGHLKRLKTFHLIVDTWCEGVTSAIQLPISGLWLIRKRSIKLIWIFTLQAGLSSTWSLWLPWQYDITTKIPRLRVHQIRKYPTLHETEIKALELEVGGPGSSHYLCGAPSGYHLLCRFVE